MNGGVEAALVGMRLVQFASAMVLLGVLSFRLLFGPGAAAEAEARAAFDHWLRRLLLVASVFALASGVLWLDLEAAIMGNGWSEALDPDTVAAVLFDTLFGSAWQWHLGFAAALVIVLAVVPPRRGWFTTALALGAGVVVSLAWAGHAVMVPGIVHVGVQVLHLAAGALWLGSLPALFYLAGRARRDRSGVWRALLARILPRYSRAGYGAVALILLTGCLNSWFLVGRWSMLIDTPYGQVLLVKIALVLAMVGVAAANRFALVPRLLAQRTAPVEPLWRAIALEQGFAVLILAAVSLLGTLAPGPP